MTTPDAGRTDAGVARDAGFDAGLETPDAGEPDAGIDAGPPTWRSTRCESPRDQQPLRAGQTLALPPSATWVMDLASSPDGRLFLLAPQGLYSYDENQQAWSTLATDAGQLPGQSFQSDLQALDDEHVYWNQGTQVREWRNGQLVDHFPGTHGELLGVFPASATELWAVGYDNTVLHEVNGTVSSIDLLSQLPGVTPDTSLQLWRIVPVGDDLMVIGVANGMVPGLSGLFAVVARLRLGQWELRALNTAPAIGLFNFAAPTCNGTLIVGGDLALLGHIDNQLGWFRFQGGTFGYDFMIGDLVESCGGKTYVGFSSPGPFSTLSLLQESPLGLVDTDDKVPGMASAPACVRGVLYYADLSAQPPVVRRYR